MQQPITLHVNQLIHLFLPNVTMVNLHLTMVGRNRGLLARSTCSLLALAQIV
jgi:hypothetical protein